MELEPFEDNDVEAEVAAVDTFDFRFKAPPILLLFITDRKSPSTILDNAFQELKLQNIYNHAVIIITVNNILCTFVFHETY